MPWAWPITASCWSIPVTVVMPRFAPLIKRTDLPPAGRQRRCCTANRFTRPSSTRSNWPSESRLTYIHGFDDPAIIAGQGTVGLEILEQVPDVEAIVVPIGGGGLAAGVALAVQER